MVAVVACTSFRHRAWGVHSSAIRCHAGAVCSRLPHITSDAALRSLRSAARSARSAFTSRASLRMSRKSAPQIAAIAARSARSARTSRASPRVALVCSGRSLRSATRSARSARTSRVSLRRRAGQSADRCGRPPGRHDPPAHRARRYECGSGRSADRCDRPRGRCDPSAHRARRQKGRADRPSDRHDPAPAHRARRYGGRRSVRRSARSAARSARSARMSCRIWPIPVPGRHALGAVTWGAATWGAATWVRTTGCLPLDGPDAVVLHWQAPGWQAAGGRAPPRCRRPTHRSWHSARRDLRPRRRHEQQAGEQVPGNHHRSRGYLLLLHHMDCTEAGRGSLTPRASPPSECVSGLVDDRNLGRTVSKITLSEATTRMRVVRSVSFCRSISIGDHWQSPR